MPYTNSKNSSWSRQAIFVLTAVFCGCLWGSASSCVKAGYRLFQVPAGDIASQILFAGVRFALAGFLVIIFGSLMKKQVLLPHISDARGIATLALWQTILQYILFYVGLAHASAVRSSILSGT